MSDTTTTEPTTTTETEPETFPAEVVRELREENAARRVSEREATDRADALASRLMASSIAAAARGILEDPSDLTASDDLLDEDGFPDPAKIEAAAHALVERKPHLAARKFGDVDQGARPQSASFDFAGMLRGAAG